MSRRHWFGERTIELLPALRRYARTLAGEQQADDLVQEALALAYGRQESFRSDGNLRNWLFTILHNRFVSGWRRERVERAALEDLTIGASAQLEANQEHAVQLDDVTMALAALSTDQRAVLHLVVVEGLSYEDAARVLQVPVGTVMSRLSRARALLRRVLDGEPTVLKLVKGAGK
jgi:RNA polymerase sigma-70 factor, ECF subfamily